MSNPSSVAALHPGALTNGFLVWIADVASVVLIVLCNKALMSPPVSFTFPVTLTAAHFACTATASVFLKHFARKSHDDTETHLQDPALPGYVICMFVLVSSAAIITVNISLMLNSVAFYQIVKMLTLPFVAAVETFLHTKQYSWKHVAAFSLILTGVSLTIDGDLEIKSNGAVVALVSVCFAGTSQFMCSRLQEKYHLSPSNLLLIISPYKTAVLLMIGPLIDRAFFSESWVTSYAWSSGNVGATLFLASCILAVAVNFAQYTAIHLLGPGIYAALSQVKTAALIISGSFLFQARANPEQMVGMALAVGAVWQLALLERGVKSFTHVLSPAESKRCPA